MKALLLTRPSHLEVADVPAPTPADDEVLVRVAACGICGSDVHGYDGSSGRRIPPIVMGHEAAGTVADAGSTVTRVHKGDRVTFDSTLYCGECGFCRRGDVNLCDRREVLGVSCAEFRRAGAFAEYVAVPERIVYPLPDQLSFAEAAMLEAVSVALHAVSLADVAPGVPARRADRDSTALVVGAGMIGLLILQALRVAGYERVLVVDVDASRLKLASELGASETANANDPDLPARISSISGGAGVDVAVEAVGVQATVALAISSVRKGGTVVLVGNVSPEVTIPLQTVVTRQLRLQGSCASAGEYPRAIELVTNHDIRVQPLITAVAPLEAGPRWFERLHAREPNLMKIVLTPGSSL
jgi:L-iditol 2-dehydrogenase